MKSKSKQDWAYDAPQHTAFLIADTFVGEKKRHFFRVRKYNFPPLNRLCWIEVRANIAQMVCYSKSEMDRRQTGEMYFFFNPNGDLKRFSNSNGDSNENQIEEKKTKQD